MACSIVGSGTVGTALACQFARSGIACIANTRGVTATLSQDGLSTDVMTGCP